MVFIKVSVNEKGQIVIPKAFRDAFGIKPGSDVMVGEKGNELVIRKKWTKKQFAAVLDAFPKWDVGTIDSDKDYAEELDSR
ncbi:MAG: AbrB/MazE/SpoVT family DNA-binding domain-containing protein [Candidatus Micrarchaeota archaeon]|nr:AbrB/MazE/SpoVT family DNA-binding domain-containing protein [Candidatus Micrarchaeota archaeon]